MDLRRPVLETGRLWLRPLSLADADEFFQLHRDPEVTRFIDPLTREQAVARLTVNEGEWDRRGHGMFAVLQKPGARFLGRCGLKYWEQFDEVEIGWVLRRDAWGHGYATEAASAVLQWGFESLVDDYFTAMIRAENDRSIAVARRLWMEPLREDTLLGQSVVVYAIERGVAQLTTGR